MNFSSVFFLSSAARPRHASLARPAQGRWGFWLWALCWSLSGALWLALLLGAMPARADLTISVTGADDTPLPVGVANFDQESLLFDPRLPSNATPKAAPLSQIIRADLARIGQFRLVEAGNSAPSPFGVMPVLSVWQALGADALVIGGVRLETPDTALIRLRLFDTITQRQIVGVDLRTRTQAADVRRAAHQLADVIYEALTNTPGIFSTRIAYVLVKSPPAPAGAKPGKTYELQIADADGYNARSILTSAQPLLSPSWSDDGSKIAYVSYESRKPVIYVQDIYTGHRSVVANFRGSNSAPAFARGQNALFATLTLTGSSQIYQLPLDAGQQPRRVMQSAGIDTESNISPDGQWLAFTSDRGGEPQIYRLKLGSGDEAQRISYEGNYNTSPRFSPNGQYVAYVRRDEQGRFGVALLDFSAQKISLLTSGPADESPSFAPNGRFLLYATRRKDRGSLAIVSTNGRIRQQLDANGDVREPAWGPFPPKLPMSGTLP